MGCDDERADRQDRWHLYGHLDDVRSQRFRHRTLERWRWTGDGPKFLKVGGRVVYRLSDIEEYEKAW